MADIKKSGDDHVKLATVSPLAATAPPPTDRHRERRTEQIVQQLRECRNEVVARNLRDELTLVNMCVAQTIARRYRRRGERDDDLEQVALLGLVKAVAGFDPQRGKNFLTYAVPTIVGELKRHFRDHCWAVRPPRRIQELQGQLGECLERLSQQLGRWPTSTEIARDLQFEVADVVEALSADGCFATASLDAPVGDDQSGTVVDLVGDCDREFTRREVQLTLAPLLSDLPSEERQILGLRFFLEWSQSQIASHLGITQMQVSRILSRTMRQLRGQLEAA